MQRVIMNAKARALMNMAQGARRFVSEVEQAAAEAASIATEVSQVTFRSQLSGRPFAPARPGRRTTQGEFGGLIRWQASGNTGNIGATFDLAALATRAPYWIIQEIGTGESARVYGGAGQPEYSIPSQVGRRISKNLMWANGPLVAGQIDASEGSHGRQQLYLVPPGGNMIRGRRAMKIQKEIKGKHFVQAGGAAGFSVFAATVKAAVDNIL